MAFSKTLFLLALCLCSANINVHSEFEALECLNVPTRELVSSVKATIEMIQQLNSVLSGFARVKDDFRLSVAVRDCQDLIDTSVHELSWVVSASLNRNSKENGTGNMHSDLKTWLGGALIDQETCKDGFDGTNGTVKNLISGTLDLISSSLHDLLKMVKPTPITSSATGRGGKKSKSHDKFPIWLSPHDQNLLNSTNTTVNAVVASDGTGNFSRIGDAIAVAPEYSAKRYVIHVRRGVYYEYVMINKAKWNIMIFGDGRDETVIRGNHNHVDGNIKTFDTATFAVKGKGFIARDITFENTAGPHKRQAVAFVSDSDESVLYRCAFRGYQDTLYAHKNRQFYRECYITGTVDFICGHAAAVFQNCQITARKGLVGQKNTITAQSREKEDESGFSIQSSNITVEQDVLNLNITYLGRPWKQYSRTVVMESYIGHGVRPEGWLEWNGSLFLNSLYYGEYMNSGPGAGLAARVKWPGYHIFNDSAQALPFTVSKLIAGDTWIPATGIVYTSGLANKN